MSTSFAETGTRKVTGSNNLRALIDAGIEKAGKTPIDRTKDFTETATIRFGATGEVRAINPANDTITYEGTETVAAV